MIKNTPKVRFAGFTDAWETRKLNSLMDFSNGFNGSSTLYGTGIPYISVMDILNNDFITYECIRGKVNIDEQTLKRFAVDYGDVLFQRSSENVEDAGSSNVYLGNKTAAFGGFVIRGKKKSEYDGFFIKNLLDSETVRKQITSKAQGAQHINVSQETLSDVIVSIPSIEEQVSIGKLFASINETITLHQRKYDELQLFKKSLLQKMFPMDGETKPEIRLAGFTDAWELRKFGEILVEFSNKSKTENEYPVLSSTNTGMEYRDGRVSGTSNIGYKIINNNDLVLSPQNLWLGNININDIGIGIVSPSYKTFKLRGIETDFFRPQIRNTYLMNEYYNASIQGASVVRRNLDVEKFNDISIFVPSYSEQVAIGCFFRNLDNLITHHQRKLELLKNIKIALLQNMFI